MAKKRQRMKSIMEIPKMVTKDKYVEPLIPTFQDATIGETLKELVMILPLRNKENVVLATL